jgi:hypothetical protein
MKINKFKTTQLGREKVEELYNSLEELNMLEDCKNAIDENSTPDEISRCAAKMSALLCRMGELVTELVTEANECYIYRKLKYGWEFNSLSVDLNVGNREAIAQEKTFEERQDELVSRYVADFMKTKYEDYNRFVSILQSRIKILNNEIFKSNVS